MASHLPRRAGAVCAVLLLLSSSSAVLAALPPAPACGATGCTVGACHDCATCASGGPIQPPACADPSTAPMVDFGCAALNYSAGLQSGAYPALPLIDGLFSACHSLRRRCVYADTPGCVVDSGRGVIVPGGFNMASISTSDVDGLSTALVSNSTKTTLKLYNERLGQDAVVSACHCDHQFPQSDAKDLYEALMLHRTSEVEQMYDAQRHAGTAAFTGVPQCFRTAMVDMFWDRELPSAATQFWDAALGNNWSDAQTQVLAYTSSTTSNDRQLQLGRIMQVCRQACSLDVMITLDMSRTVTSTGWADMKTAVIKMIAQFPNLTQQGTRIGLNTFSTVVTKRFEMNQWGTLAEYEAAINVIDYTDAGNNAIGLGMEAAMDSFNNPLYPRPPSKLVPKVMIVIVNGANDVEYSSYQARVDAVHDAGITVFAAGIPSTSTADLAQITGGDTAKAFDLASFDELIDVAQLIGGHTCDAGVQADNGTVTVLPGQTRHLSFTLAHCAGVPFTAITVSVSSGLMNVYVSHDTPNPSVNPSAHNYSVSIPSVSSATINVKGTLAMMTDPAQRVYVALTAGSLGATADVSSAPTCHTTTPTLSATSTGPSITATIAATVTSHPTESLTLPVTHSTSAELPETHTHYGPSETYEATGTVFTVERTVTHTLSPWYLSKTDALSATRELPKSKSLPLSVSTSLTLTTLKTLTPEPTKTTTILATVTATLTESATASKSAKCICPEGWGVDEQRGGPCWRLFGWSATDPFSNTWLGCDDDLTRPRDPTPTRSFDAGRELCAAAGAVLAADTTRTNELVAIHAPPGAEFWVDTRATAADGSLHSVSPEYFGECGRPQPLPPVAAFASGVVANGTCEFRPGGPEGAGPECVVGVLQLDGTLRFKRRDCSSRAAVLCIRRCVPSRSYAVNRQRHGAAVATRSADDKSVTISIVGQSLAPARVALVKYDVDDLNAGCGTMAPAAMNIAAPSLIGYPFLPVCSLGVSCEEFTVTLVGIGPHSVTDSVPAFGETGLPSGGGGAPGRAVIPAGPYHVCFFYDSPHPAMLVFSEFCRDDVPQVFVSLE